MSLGERYVRLGLRIGRREYSVVDAYFGPPELADAVDAEPLPEPGSLVTEAEALLAELPDGWLRDQVLGLRTYAGVLAGEARPYADEVEGCYGVHVGHTDEEVFARAHERLGELLPGDGPLAHRYARWEESIRVPEYLIEPTITAVIAEARRQTAGLVELPDGERIELEIVHDAPWLGYNDYLGDLRGRVSANIGLPMSAIELLRLALHETYPGHQAERAVKEHVLVRGRGLVEETIVLAPTPQSLIGEGIAQLAPGVLLGGEGGPAFAAIVHDAGVPFDLAHALAIGRALEPCRWAQVNVALMRYEHGADDAEIRAYLERWGLLSPELSAHVLRFMSDPASRTYVVNYPAGRTLCGSYVGTDRSRFRRLLTEQVRVTDLRDG